MDDEERKSDISSANQPHGEGAPEPGGLKPATPPDEEARLADLRDMRILDSAGELEFDHLVQTAALIAGTQIAALSLIDQDRQWFKSSTGIEGSEAPRDIAFCAHAINEPDQPFIVEDAASDPRFADNPLVAHSPGIGFYAGIPVVSANGHAVGTICVADSEPGSADRGADRGAARDQQTGDGPARVEAQDEDTRSRPRAGTEASGRVHGVATDSRRDDGPAGSRAA